ncbi:hypothetical protein LJ739_00790 [Aestuariibacter halophilus]|uniref:MFS transporter permease n=1 Tax=Fluctibacter halophilus TaxID=226011 RepID=A0ABS8G6E1_9ALTE|nr:hypothetical protein [Aestuariibacter halophilus]MCC2614776.1 hypothetical protein [Aestuariibacter halophilus]
MNYQLEHFLLFSAQTYDVIIQAHAQLSLPISVLILMTCLYGAWHLWRVGNARWIAIALTIAWCWLSWHFYTITYSSINPWALWGGGFGLLMITASIAAAVTDNTVWTHKQRCHLLVGCLFTLIIFPALMLLLPPLAWLGVGVIPLPTLMLSLAFFHQLRFKGRVVLLMLLYLWLGLEGITLYAMGNGIWQVIPVVLVIYPLMMAKLPNALPRHLLS